MQQQRHTFDVALRELKLKLLNMGGDVQEAIRRAVESLVELDGEKAQLVVNHDKNINQQEFAIEDLCIRLIATQQPVATDLRKIVAGLRIATDLERMADNAVDIAKTTLRMQGEPLIKPLIDIPKMGQLVDTMISDALNAYIDGNVELARKLAEDDDAVDHLYRNVVTELFHLGVDKPETITQAMSLSFVGRHLERIGDHATNIGESVIYIISGERSDLN